MKEGNECPRSVKFCLQRQRLKNPQQDQNQLNGNERVPVVCVRKSVKIWLETTNVNWHVKVVCQESSKHWTKHSLPKRLPTGTGPASLMPYDIWSLQNSCEIYDLRWPHRHLFDCDSITSSGEAVKGVFLVFSCYILTCLHARQGLSRPLAMLIRWLFWKAFDNVWDGRSSEP